MSERLEQWLGYWQMLRAVDWARVSSGGIEFLAQTRPTSPIRSEYLLDTRATRIWWSDGAIEDIEDVMMRAPKR